MPSPVRARREALGAVRRDDLEVVELRGNVDTRLRKLAEGGLDAIVIAVAGLARLGRESEIGTVLDEQNVLRRHAYFTPVERGCSIVLVNISRLPKTPRNHPGLPQCPRSLRPTFPVRLRALCARDCQPRTATLGAMICLADAIEIFTLNMTYDVPVKLLSSHLVFMSLFGTGVELTMTLEALRVNHQMPLHALQLASELAGGSLVLNELAETRAGLLGHLFPGIAVTRFDAAHIHDHLDANVVPSVVLMNPPFSAVANVDRRMADAALRHIASALSRLAEGGRLVAAGTPEEVARAPASHTGRWLRTVLPAPA